MKGSGNSAISRILDRYGLAPMEPHGSDSVAAAHGGLLAIVDIARLADSSGLMRVQIGERDVAAHCPVTEDRATEVVRRFQDDHTVPHDAGFAAMFANVLTKLSKLYVESGARTLSVTRLHLHRTSYHIDDLSMEPKSALYVKPRRSPDGGRAPVEIVPKRHLHRR
jgi:hypothetical protein